MQLSFYCGCNWITEVKNNSFYRTFYRTLHFIVLIYYIGFRDKKTMGIFFTFFTFSFRNQSIPLNQVLATQFLTHGQLYNIKKIRPFLSERATQLLVQALVLSRLDYYNALLAGLPDSSIKLLQLIQNAAARLIFNEPKRTHVTPLFINLLWLPIAARIKFKALMFAYRTTSGSAPLYLNSLLQTYMPSRSLHSASE